MELHIHVYQLGELDWTVGSFELSILLPDFHIGDIITCNHYPGLKRLSTQVLVRHVQHVRQMAVTGDC